MHCQIISSSNLQIRMLSPWIHASRPRTLPLALAGSILGSLLAAADGTFRWIVFVLAALTSLLLQILSNLANDYGDFTKGTDSHDRIGPARMVTTGDITPRKMVWAIAIVSLLTLAVGISLIVVGFSGGGALIKLLFLLLGVGAIAAAIKYTVGKNPYGYSGFGDVFVFIFFGLVSVVGTYYLHAKTVNLTVFLPAISLGLLSTGVLNLNNLRDEQSDIKAKKHTLVVLMGGEWGKVYHAALVCGAIVAASVYVALHYQSLMQLLFMVSVPFLLRNVAVVFRNRIPSNLNSELKNLSLSTLLFAITFGVGLML